LSDPNDDAELVARAKLDAEAFGTLYERYVGKIYSYLYYRTGNTHDAEDLTARVFQRALVNLNRYTSRGLPFSAWLYRIAHNLVANWHRDQGRRQHLPLHEAALQDLPALRAEATEVLVLEACAPFDDPNFRNTLIAVKQRSELTIDEVSVDEVTFAGFDAAAKEKAAGMVQSFKQFMETHRDELTALQIIYNQPYGRRHLTDKAIKELAAAIVDFKQNGAY
jgi:RNA polymerase sigma-70 factor (ECF subfamily)